MKIQSGNDENGGHIMEIAQGELVQKEPDNQPVDRAEELFTSHALIQKRQNSQLIDLYRQEPSGEKTGRVNLMYKYIVAESSLIGVVWRLKE
ncbi:UNVERIFIED_CONTAM: hypothetical protein NCL1_35131 [Trichonephila clavipes]